MAKNKRGGNLTPEQIVSGAPRAMEGTEAMRLSGSKSDSSHVQMRPRNTGASGDPAYMPVGGRNQVINENLGPAYKGIPASLNRGVDPTVGPTQFQGRTLAPQISRESGSFWDGAKG